MRSTTITLSTAMLILLQHNAAHLGIATGFCLAEACTRYYPAWLSRSLLSTGVCAVVATAFE
jgi:manganese transport protein